ncbi:hypothetical protein [Arthrobacter sp. ov118]|uniref:hypothetical protein n=1 Tax=Arthrobacter sp. ov118 TaxID=1761747 RepID=UPI0008F0C694|nr:hypothetical protein [Arthrobacter sp. ov118]SFT92594.1 hypothetical protein SAMN04487915_105193 [Arthrobacter sp. ov118]
MPELGFRVRLSLSNDLEVELTLNLAVQDLQLPISDIGEIQGKMQACQPSVEAPV